MARSKGSANLAASLEVLAGAPLDAREVVQTKSALTDSESFPYKYIGMEVYVVSENKKYRLIANDPTDIESWEEIVTGTAGDLVVNGYASTVEIDSALAFITAVNGVSSFPEITVDDASVFSGMDASAMVLVCSPTMAYLTFADKQFNYSVARTMFSGTYGMNSYKSTDEPSQFNGYSAGPFNYAEGITALATNIFYTTVQNDLYPGTGKTPLLDNDNKGWIYACGDVNVSSTDYADSITVLSEALVFYEDSECTIEIIPTVNNLYYDQNTGKTYYWNGGRYILVSGGSGGETYTAGGGINISAENEISTDNLQEGDMDDIVNPLPVPGGGGSGGSAALESDVTSNMAVGAIANGTTLTEGTSFTEFVQKLLITEIAPTIAFSISKSGNVAYGGSYTEMLTVNVSNMGTAKKIKTIEWYEGSTLKKTDTIDSTTTGSWTYTMDTATTFTTTFKAIVKYTKSNDADDQQTKTASINFYFNKFYGGVADLNPSEATVEALTSALATGKGGTYSFTVSAGRICYAYPKSLGALSSIKDGNGFSLFDSFTRTEQTYTQAGQSVVYYRYVLTDATTVSGYSVVFA